MKRINKRFSKLGFNCLSESKYGVVYGRDNESGTFRHIIAIVHKLGGRYLIQSYQENINSDGLNNMIGMSPRETKLAIKAGKRMWHKYKWCRW